MTRTHPQPTASSTSTPRPIRYVVTTVAIYALAQTLLMFYEISRSLAAGRDTVNGLVTMFVQYPVAALELFYTPSVPLNATPTWAATIILAYAVATVAVLGFARR